VYIDDFKVVHLPLDNEVTFKIDGDQVYFNGSMPTMGNNPLVAGRSYVMLNEIPGWGGPQEYGFSYACTRDVTALVRAFCDEGAPPEGTGHYPGNGLYTVDDVSADTTHEGSPSHLAHAGWSLIVVYASPDTAGHYIYIRDDNFAFYPGDGSFLDFDEDGTPGGQITNFVIPEPILDEFGGFKYPVAAQLTCFITEGDVVWGDDWGEWDKITIRGQQSGLSKELSNDQSPADNVWNGLSYPGTYDEGVDIDTFEVLWADNILTPDDDVVYVDIESSPDAWNLVYFIISIRSETTTGGTSHYVIYG
jgi:hypothetical protein